jgi:hypothetical protein
VRDSARAKLRLLVKRILRKYKYPPVKEEAARCLGLGASGDVERGIGLGQPSAAIR